jgi:hypothetical protein
MISGFKRLCGINVRDCGDVSSERLKAIGHQFVIGRVSHVVCECECGAFVVVGLNKLKNGHTRSCGCLKSDEAKARFTTHGLRKSRIYGTWGNIVNRTENKSGQDYDDYGGRGIRMCQGWRLSASAFSHDIGERPTAKHSVDRINNELGYNCGQCAECVANEWEANCRWATVEQQRNNTRRNVFVTLYGKTMTVSRWSRISGIAGHVVNHRLTNGWPDKLAVFAPLGSRLKSLLVQQNRGES